MLHQDTAKQIQVQLVYIDFQPQLSLSPLKAAMEFLGQSSKWQKMVLFKKVGGWLVCFM